MTQNERAVRREVLVQAAVEDVWNAWTKEEGARGFFAPQSRIDLRPGGAFEHYFFPAAPPGARGAEGTVILAVQPRRLLSFTWDAPPHLPLVRAQRTVVIVRFIEEAPARTRVLLHQTGWGDGGEWDAAFDYFERAWGIVLDRLARLFTEGPFDWSTLPQPHAPQHGRPETGRA